MLLMAVPDALFVRSWALQRKLVDEQVCDDEKTRHTKRLEQRRKKVRACGRAHVCCGESIIVSCSMCSLC
jgi:hypothetical protein